MSLSGASIAFCRQEVRTSSRHTWKECADAHRRPPTDDFKLQDELFQARIPSKFSRAAASEARGKHIAGKQRPELLDTKLLNPSSTLFILNAAARWCKSHRSDNTFRRLRTKEYHSRWFAKNIHIMGTNLCNSHGQRQRRTTAAILLSLLRNNSLAFQNPVTSLPSTSLRRPSYSSKAHILFSTQLDREVETTRKFNNSDNNNNNNNLNEEPTILDLSSYETALLSAWDADASLQKGFDWEIEKLRRHFAGLRQRESDGAWVHTSSIFDFLVTHTPSSIVSVDANGKRYEAPPRPVNMLDVGVLVTKNVLNGLGFGSTLGMAAVPDAVIQKYEGSFFSFIKGVLGGDLQTLAGGPLFLLLAKYYKDYGPIFNLSFGPKSFLVISDPVMARHILRDSSPEHYCKGMLAEILEPIMGDGLIPADPKIWKAST